MNGFNKYIFHKNTYITNPLYSAIILGTIFASSAVLAEVPTEITKYTLQREKSVNHAQSSLHEEQVPEIEKNEWNE